MKFKTIFNLAKNKTNHQYTFSLKIKQLKKLGMTPEELMELTMPKPRIKFYKK